MPLKGLVVSGRWVVYVKSARRSGTLTRRRTVDDAVQARTAPGEVVAKRNAPMGVPVWGAGKVML
jgi:hypothetical protein